MPRNLKKDTNGIFHKVIHIDPDMIPVIDLFAGPGGLAEGFFTAGKEGLCPFKVTLSIEKDKAAYQTLELRTFFREFPKGEAPDEYYSHLRGEVTKEELFGRFPLEAARARKKVWPAELGSKEVSADELDRRIREAIGFARKWVLIGGPPCQAYSVAGRSRNKGVKNYRPERDPRHFLYKEYLRIIRTYWPPVFVMENVAGIISSRVNGDSIFKKIMSDLSDPQEALGDFKENGDRSSPEKRYNIYSLVKPVKDLELFGSPKFNPFDYIIHSECFGIPQTRHRLILLGVRGDLKAEPEILAEKNIVRSREVLRGLPRLRGGLSREDDSAEFWIERLKESKQQQWWKDVREKAGKDVRKLLKRTVARLICPKHGRGGEFIRFKPELKHARDWYIDPRLVGVCNSTTRAHMVSDLYRYLYAACFAEVHGESPTLADFPIDLLPDHRNVAFSLGHDNFTDRFRVQLYSQPATTITSHISKDGHYYIHPDPKQCRSLTVREAARIQTFPDNYFFCGNRTEQYTQVGNAVPPLLALQIAEIVLGVLRKAGRAG